MCTHIDTNTPKKKKNTLYFSLQKKQLIYLHLCASHATNLVRDHLDLNYNTEARSFTISTFHQWLLHALTYNSYTLPWSTRPLHHCVHSQPLDISLFPNFLCSNHTHLYHLLEHSFHTLGYLAYYSSLSSHRWLSLSLPSVLIDIFPPQRRLPCPPKVELPFPVLLYHSTLFFHSMALTTLWSSWSSWSSCLSYSVPCTQSQNCVWSIVDAQ